MIKSVLKKDFSGSKVVVSLEQKEIGDRKGAEEIARNRTGLHEHRTSESVREMDL